MRGRDTWVPRGTDCFIFDVDGVLIDTLRSFPYVICTCVESRWTGAGGEYDTVCYTDETKRAFKDHGSFNDDYDIAWTILNILAARSRERGTRSASALMPAQDELERMLAPCSGSCVEWVVENFGTEFPRDEIRACCEAIYFGDGWQPSGCSMEKPLVTTHWSIIPMPVYIFSGRDMREWEAAAELLGWGDLPKERVVHRGLGMLKPSPDGIAYICERFGHSCPAYFGDTASDRRSIAAFARGTFVAIGPLVANEPLHFDGAQAAIDALLTGDDSHD